MKLTATYDRESYRFIISPLKPGNTMDIPSVFKAIKDSTTVSWRILAQFAGLRNQSEAFKVAYLSNPRPVIKTLNDFLVIDVDRNKAYFYDHEHKPASVLPPHVRVSIKNGEPSDVTVKVNVPQKVTSRVVISDPLNRILTLKLTPLNGYILGINDINVKKDQTYVVTGNVQSLNQLLKQIHFVATDSSTTSGSIVVSVDDNDGEISSVVSTTVTFKIEEATDVPAPAINIPETEEIYLNEENSFTAITVSEPTGQLLEFRISPFGCKIYGFTDYLFPVVPGQVRNIHGSAEYINSVIAALKVVPHQENASLGMELICGKTKLREYLRFNVNVEGAPVEEEEVPTFHCTTSEFEGYEESEFTIGMTLEGNRKSEFEFTITPNNCTLYGLASKDDDFVESGTPHTFTGTVEAINEELALAKVILGATSGSIDISYLDQTASVPVTVKTIGLDEVQPGTTVNMTVAQDVQGNAGEEKALTPVLASERKFPMNLTITPENCSVKGLTSSAEEIISSGNNKIISGTIEELNAEIANLKVVLGDTTGTVTFAYLDQSKEVTCTVNPVV